MFNYLTVCAVPTNDKTDPKINLMGWWRGSGNSPLFSQEDKLTKFKGQMASKGFIKTSLELVS